MKKISLIIVFSLVLFSMLTARGQTEVPEIPPVTSGPQYLSPTGDGIQDTAKLDFSVKIFVKSNEGFVPEYGLQIASEDGLVVREIVEKEQSDIFWLFSLFRGYQEFNLDKSLEWDGKDEDGNVVPDGEYMLTLWVIDETGNRSETKVDAFIVDTVAPSANVQVDGSKVFAPGTESAYVNVTIQQDGSEEVLWLGEIFSKETDSLIQSFTWENSSPQNFTWDGKDANGNLAANGMYYYKLSSTDLAGNTIEPIIIDDLQILVQDTPLNLSFVNQHFSPNDEGVQDEAIVNIHFNQKDGIIRWGWIIRDMDGRPLYEEHHDNSEAAERVAFNGRDQDGQLLDEGVYMFVYYLKYENGNQPIADRLIHLDLSPPIISINAGTGIFSPNNDGINDYLEVQFRSNKTVTWQGSVKDEAGNRVLETSSEKTTSLIRWDGKDAQGNPLADGTYLVNAVFTDRAGNSTKISNAQIGIDRRPIGIHLEVPALYSHKAPAPENRMRIGIDADLHDEVDRWIFRIHSYDGEKVFEKAGTEQIPENIVWEGNTLTGMAVDGYYKASLNVRYDRGDVTTVFSDAFKVDVTAPQVNVKVTSSPFAKTDEGLEGEAFITLDIYDNDEVDTWEMDILDSQDNIIRSFSGTGDPSSQIVWQGEGSSPDPDAQYLLLVTVRDMAGNETRYESKLNVDVIVVKRDGKLYLMVPNIIFSAYQHALDSAGTSQYNKNMSSLQQVYRISQQYENFTLMLEGHALNVFHAQNSENERREEQVLMPLTRRRTETVAQALVSLGLNSERVETAYFGGQHPISPVRDLDVRWKNRRVEFIMIPYSEEDEEEILNTLGNNNTHEAETATDNDREEGN